MIVIMQEDKKAQKPIREVARYEDITIDTALNFARGQAELWVDQNDEGEYVTQVTEEEDGTKAYRFNITNFEHQLVSKVWLEFPDVLVENNGLFTFEPQNDKARDWIDENVSSEGWQWMGNRLCVEGQRNAMELAQGMMNDGLCVH